MESTTSTMTLAAAETANESAAADLQDFDTLVRNEQRRIYRVLFSMLRDSDAADTLTQECFLKAYEHRKRFRGECSLRTWLLRIAVNLARDHLKNRRLQFWRRLAEAADPERLHTAPDLQASPEQQLIAREELAKVWAALDDLSPQQRVVFVLRFVEDMDIDQIAEATSLRPGTVKAHLFRATTALRQTLKGRKR
jgi:RNA polymerase sigma-70 factor (ECF subfamily)